MNKKIIITAVPIIVLGFLLFLIFPTYLFDPLDKVLDHIRQSRKVATYFEKERNLRVGQDEEYKIFRIPKKDFDELCRCLEPDGWKSEVLFTTRHTGRVWILYGKNFPPFTVKWMKAHEKEAAAEANRLIWRYRIKILLYFLGIVSVLLIIYGLTIRFGRQRLPN